MTAFLQGIQDFQNACSVDRRPTLSELLAGAPEGLHADEAREWAEGWLVGWDRRADAECEHALRLGALDAQNARLDGTPDDDELRAACEEHYGHSFTGAVLDAWVEGYLGEERSHGPRRP